MRRADEDALIAMAMEVAAERITVDLVEAAMEGAEGAVLMLARSAFAGGYIMAIRHADQALAGAMPPAAGVRRTRRTLVVGRRARR